MNRLYFVIAIYALVLLGLLIATLVYESNILDESRRAADASVALNETIQESVVNIDKAVAVIKEDIEKLIEYLKQLFPPP